MRTVKTVRNHHDGGQTQEVSYPRGFPQRLHELTDEERQEIKRVKRLCGDDF